MRFWRFLIWGGGLAVVLAGAFYFGWSFANISKSLEAASSNLAYNAKSISDRYDEIIGNRDMVRRNKLTLVLVGDVMLDRGVAYQIRKNNDFRYSFLKIADYLGSADLVFGNLEGPITDRGAKQGSIYSFRFDPKVAESLKWAGFDVLSLANNHILDYGREALTDTLDILRLNGIHPVGAGQDYEEANRPVLLQIKSTKVAFLAYTNLYPKSFMASEDSAGISDFDLGRIQEKVRAARGQADLLIVSFHWGEEYRASSSQLQQEIGRAFVDAGADLIIGHHPHVPQEIEQYSSRLPALPTGQAGERSGWIIYSLGNFVFDQNFSKETMEGVIIEVLVEGGKIVAVTPVPIKINPTFQPYLPEK